MFDNGWIPYDYFDEVIPGLKGHPTQWIGRFDDGAPGLLDFEGEQAARRLVDGEAVSFLEYRDYGQATLTSAPDGSWSVDRPMPEGANGVWCAEVEQGGNDVAGLVSAWKEAAAGDWASSFADSGPVTISYGWWSETIPFRFDAGSNSFLQVAS